MKRQTITDDLDRIYLQCQLIWTCQRCQRETGHWPDNQQKCTVKTCPFQKYHVRRSLHLVGADGLRKAFRKMCSTCLTSIGRCKGKSCRLYGKGTFTTASKRPTSWRRGAR